MARSKDIDLLHGTLWDKMVVFAVPLALTGVLQQLFNAADVAVLGHLVSRQAMAAVGNNVPIIGLIVALCMGLALGANVVVARAIGMGEPERANRAVHTAFALAVVFGIAVALIGELTVDWVLRAMEVPADVYEPASDYLRVYLWGMPFIAVYNFLSAAYRSRGDTRTPLWALCAATVFNIAGNIFFVLVPEWGTAGVALATVLANVLAAGILFVLQARMEGVLHLDIRHLFRIDGDALRSMIRIGWPAGLQGMVFSLSNVVIQSAINSLGADAMAGSVAAFTIEINVYCSINAFGMAATTFVSQAYGAGDLARCRRAMWVSMGLNMAATCLLVAFILIFARELLGCFTDSESVIAFGIIRILWVVIPEPVSVVMESVSGAMRGYGYSLPPALVTLVCVCSIRIIWVYTAFAASPDYSTLMAVYPLSWVVTMVLLVVLYFRHQKTLAVRAGRIRARVRSGRQTEESAA